MKSNTVTLLVALGVSLFALWFFNTYHQVERERYVGYSGEARHNHFLAARLLLERLEIEAESRASITPTEWLPDFADTLIVHLSSSLAVGDERDSLLNWADAGGSLILLAGEATVNTDEFLEALGYSIDSYTIEYTEDDEDNEGADEIYNPYALENYHEPKFIEPIDEQASSKVVMYDGKIMVARREWGDGVIAVVANAHYFDNDHLAVGKHASLFMDLVSGEYDSGKVWFVYNTAFRSLWQVIWSAAPLLVLGLLMLLLLWLWSEIPIFGPRVEASNIPRRSIIEHIAAAGNFVWRNHGQDGLTKSSVEALLHEAESRHPGIGRQSKERQAKSIARITGMSAQKVMDALNGPIDSKQRDFTDGMRKLQSIRKEL